MFVFLFATRPSVVQLLLFDVLVVGERAVPSGVTAETRWVYRNVGAGAERQPLRCLPSLRPYSTSWAQEKRFMLSEASVCLVILQHQLDEEKGECLAAVYKVVISWCESYS